MVDTAFHALVADTMAGARTHRVVDDNHRQRADIVALAFNQMHFGDFLIQRATDGGHAQWIDLESFGFLVAHAFGAGIGIALVAVNAVIDFGQYLALVITQVGQFKTVPTAAVFLLAHPGFKFAAINQFMLNQMVEIALLRKLEARPVRNHIVVLLRDKTPAQHDVHQGVDKFGGVLQADDVGKFACRFCVNNEFGAQSFSDQIGILIIAVFALGNQLVMAVQQPDSRADPCYAVFCVIILVGFGKACIDQQIKTVQDRGNSPIAGILAFKKERQLVDHFVFISENGVDLVLDFCALHLMLLGNIKNPGDKLADIRPHAHQQIGNSLR